VAEAIENDHAAGRFVSETAKSFVARVRNGAKKTTTLCRADQLGELLSLCDIGKERLEREVGTDRLFTIRHPKQSRLRFRPCAPILGLLAIAGKLLAMLRAPALLFYIFARDAQYRSRIGVAVKRPLSWRQAL
jgi:hypothetical protein